MVPEIGEVIDLLREIVGEQEITAETVLADLHVDSLDLLEWLHMIGDRYSLVLSDETIASLDAGHSIGEVYALLKSVA